MGWFRRSGQYVSERDPSFALQAFLFVVRRLGKCRQMVVSTGNHDESHAPLACSVVGGVQERPADGVSQILPFSVDDANGLTMLATRQLRLRAGRAPAES